MRRRKLMKWVKRGAFLAGAGGLVVAGAFVYEFDRGPRMRQQVSLRPFEAVMPAPPADAVPLESTASSASAPPTPGNIARGAVYYNYYCLACHGPEGRGDGPVGNSYMPVPADLHSARVQTAADNALLRAMLTGPGHEPVLARVVPPQHRPYLVLFVHSLRQ